MYGNKRARRVAFASKGQQSPQGKGSIIALGGDVDFVPNFESENPPDKVFYLYGPIEEEIEYVDMIQDIRYAPEGQIITIHINSPGGCLSTCLAIINAIQASRAQVIGVIDGEACSAAAFIWLSCHSKVIASKHVYFMVHEAGWLMHGNASEHQSQVLLMKKIVKGILLEFSKGLLKEEEFKDFDKGIDIYLTGEEIVERIGTTVTQPEIPEEEA